jgi:hypothetical protein
MMFVKVDEGDIIYLMKTLCKRVSIYIVSPKHEKRSHKCVDSFQLFFELLKNHYGNIIYKFIF